MNLQDLINKLRLLPDRLGSTIKGDAIAVANDVNAQVTLRRIEKGENADGNSFSDYSSPWAADRRKRGRQTAFKDYSDLNLLNASIHADVISATKGEVVVGLKPRGRDNEVKVTGAFRVEKRKGGASDRGAHILAPNDQELNTAAQSYEAKRLKQLQIIIG